MSSSSVEKSESTRPSKTYSVSSVLFESETQDCNLFHSDSVEQSSNDLLSKSRLGPFVHRDDLREKGVN